MKTFMSDNEAKQTILEIGRRMYQKNFVAANDGNISCRVADDVIWTTPTGVSKGFMSDETLVKMCLDGTVISSGSLPPSSEVKMHIRIYKENADVMGVTHAHPPVSTSFAVAGIALDKAIYSEALVSLGSVPCVHYETPGSEGLPNAIAPFCKDYHALLLSNHGALTWGSTLMEAFFRLEAMEHYATVLMNTSNIIGRANMLSREQVRELLLIRRKMGVPTGGIPVYAEEAVNTHDILAGGEEP